MAIIQEWLAGTTRDGKQLPLAKVNAYRSGRGLPPIERTTPATGSQTKSRGLGDTIAAITHATGIDRVVKAVVGNKCGCEKRRQRLNEAFHYKAQQ